MEKKTFLKNKLTMMCGLMSLAAMTLTAGTAAAYSSYGAQVDAFCPSTPFNGDCSLCHTASYADPTPAKDAFLANDLCYFCPDDAPCAPAPTCTDADNDGYFAEANCGTAVDCNDMDAAINPGATEICDNGVDENCDGVDAQCTPAPTCTDADGDGYFAEANCGTAVDCNDNDAAIYPGAAEICSDGIDNDCDQLVDAGDPDAVGCPANCTDADSDGYSVEGGDCGPVDCNDNDAAINPGAVEVCGDGIDNDCSGADRDCPVDGIDPVFELNNTCLKCHNDNSGDVGCNEEEWLAHPQKGFVSLAVFDAVTKYLTGSVCDGQVDGDRDDDHERQRSRKCKKRRSGDD